MTATSVLARMKRLIGGGRSADGDYPSGQALPYWQATHRHRKGAKYRVLSHGTWETDRSDVVIYEDESRQIWVRPVSEFYDGRFTALNVQRDHNLP
ncbi:DUF1653 domain-containing protein [Litoreibacter sp.]|nr:DUF1653 domain-containing protein [Litoreibacter sp.]